MSPIVIDASVVLKWYFHEPFSEEACRLINRGGPIYVPELLYSQVGTVLWKRVKASEMKREDAQRVLMNLSRLPLISVPTSELARPALEIASSTARTYAESVYFALAFRMDTPLVTADRRWYSLLATGPMKPLLKWVGDVR